MPLPKETVAEAWRQITRSYQDYELEYFREEIARRDREKHRERLDARTMQQ